ncbi:MAG: protein O-mannosyl-transferase family, partial [Polyangiales bacterium]
MAGPHLFDSGELVAAAWQLQGSHPPGQPLHALLGHGLAQLSLGPVSWRIAWLSWLLTLATALATGQLARTLVSATAPVTAPLK